MESASELEYQLMLTPELQFLDRADHDKLAMEVTEVKRMLTMFIRKLNADS